MRMANPGASISFLDVDRIAADGISPTMNQTLILLAALSLGAEPAAPPARGRILILDNHELIEGEISLQGERYKIRRPVGELALPASQVLTVVASPDDAFRYIRERLKPTSAEDHVRLARWCLSQRMPDHAIEQAAEAARLKGATPRFRELVCEPIRLQAEAMKAPVKPVTAPAPKPVEEEVPATDASPEAFSLFVTKIQPILTNTCTNCHSSGRAGSFKLMPASASGAISKRSLQLNLAAAAVQINRSQPSASPILLKAVVMHGDSAGPPIKDRQTAAFKYLDEWVRLMTGGRVGDSPAPSVEKATAPDAPAPLPPMSAPPISPTKATGDETESGPSRVRSNPVPPPITSDPFDPAEFNKKAKPPG